VEVVERWTSPTSRATYPVRWKLTVPSAALALDENRRLDDQEMRTSFTYWEGAVTLTGSSRGLPTTGHGYVEMTGYAGTMAGVF
jgi:predicted secreted hydrolase